MDDVPVVGSVPDPADGAVERAEIHQLTAAFHSADPALGSQLLTGPQGAGKTQLAAALARTLIGIGDLDVVVWAPAARRADVVSSYAQAARTVLGIDDLNAEAAAYRFAAWLSSERRWLVVLDGVDDPADLYALWPSTTQAGQLVVATRELDRGRTARGRPLPVGPFNPAQARAYLEDRLGGEPSRLAGADGLAADLGNLPLSLALAAAYIIEMGISCAQYRTRLVQNWTVTLRTVFGYHLSQPPPDPDAVDDSEPEEEDVAGQEILAAILLAVNAADQLRTYGLARPLLGLLSVLDPYGVPEGVITAVATLNHLAAHRFGASPDPVDGQQALACLAWLIRLGLVAPVESTVDSSGTRRLIRMHPLVHDAIRDASPNHEDRAFAAAAALVQVWPEPDEADRTFAATLRANAAVLQRCQRSYPLDRGDGVYLRRESGV